MEKRTPVRVHQGRNRRETERNREKQERNRDSLICVTYSASLPRSAVKTREPDLRHSRQQSGAATYAWDNEGRLSSRAYPNGNSFTFGYDLMGRLNTMSQDGTQQASASYGVASEITSLSYYGYTETRTYNSLLQLTRQTIPGVFDTEYIPTGANNGRITSSIDHISGDQVNYTYDSLQRLTHAETVSSAWGQTYTFDGFGNLTAKTVTKGSGTNWSAAVDPATNRMNPTYSAYDANGNVNSAASGGTATYDEENRVITEFLNRNNCGSWDNYWYDPSGKRVVTQEGCVGSFNATISFYDIFGKRIVTSTCAWGNYCGSMSADVYFAGKLVRTNGVTVVTDRLGSVRANSSNEHFSYLPYGEEQSPVTADNRIKFGTYFRDATGTTNQDYADQRYYNPWFGRFNTPDPSGRRAVKLLSPTTWNRYAYVNGDPINFNDPSGLCEDDDETDPCLAAPDTLVGGGGDGDGGGGGGGCDPEETCGGIGGYFTSADQATDANGKAMFDEKGQPIFGDISKVGTQVTITGVAAPPDNIPQPFIVHGNWCGPDWTGGQIGPYNPSISQAGGYSSPTDALDQACMNHDICYYNCRQSNACDPAGRTSCFSACDRTLSHTVDQMPPWQNGISGTAIDLVMFFRGSNLPPFRPAPGTNPANCKP